MVRVDTPTDKLLVLIAVIGIAYIGISYATEGSPTSDPSDWFKQKYTVSYKVKQAWTGAISIEDVEITRGGKASIAPFGWFNPLAFEGTTKIYITDPSGTKRTITSKSITVKYKKETPISETFTAEEPGTYEIEIVVLDQDNNIKAEEIKDLEVTEG